MCKKEEPDESKGTKLLQEVDKVENEGNIDHDLLEIKRKELCDLRQKKNVGVKFRSKAKWISEGEK